MTKNRTYTNKYKQTSAYITRWSHNRITQIRKGNMKITPSKKNPERQINKILNKNSPTKKKQTNTRNKYTDPHETPRATQKPCEA